MLSEWLIDRPADIETDWTCVLCPKGRRCLVVAKMVSVTSILLTVKGFVKQIEIVLNFIGTSRRTSPAV